MANTQLTQTGAQVQAILDKADTLPASLGTAGQVLKVNSGATGLEYGNAGGGTQNTCTLIVRGHMSDGLGFKKIIPLTNDANYDNLVNVLISNQIIVKCYNGKQGFVGIDSLYPSSNIYTFYTDGTTKTSIYEIEVNGSTPSSNYTSVTISNGDVISVILSGGAM